MKRRSNGATTPVAVARRDAVPVVSSDDLDRVRGILASLPTVACTGACAATACRDLTVSQLERSWMFTESGHKMVEVLGRCSVLDAVGRCRGHASRPFICRLYGVHEDLPCAYGCQPERWLTTLEAISLLRELENVCAEARSYVRLGPEPDPIVTEALVHRNLRRWNDSPDASEHT